MDQLIDRILSAKSEIDHGIVYLDTYGVSCNTINIYIYTDRCIDSIDIPGTHEPTVFVVHFCMLNASSGSLEPVPTFPRLTLETSIPGFSLGLATWR